MPAHASRHRARPSSPALSPSGLRRMPARALRHGARPLSLAVSPSSLHRMPPHASCHCTYIPINSPTMLPELPAEVLRLHLSNKWLVTTSHRNQLVHEYLTLMLAQISASLLLTARTQAPASPRSRPVMPRWR